MQSFAPRRRGLPRRLFDPRSRDDLPTLVSEHQAESCVVTQHGVEAAKGRAEGFELPSGPGGRARSHPRVGRSSPPWRRPPEPFFVMRPRESPPVRACWRVNLRQAHDASSQQRDTYAPSPALILPEPYESALIGGAAARLAGRLPLPQAALTRRATGKLANAWASGTTPRSTARRSPVRGLTSRGPASGGTSARVSSPQ